MWNWFDRNWTHPNETYAKYLCLLGTVTSVYEDHRVITISPSNDPSNTVFPNNRIVSKKYTLWNFIPKNLFEQFRRIANFYFLVTAVVSMMIASPISPLTSILPLSFVILVTACKQGYEDYHRHKLDQRINRKFVTAIRNKCTQNVHCEEIVVGDLVKVCRDDDVPCDLLLLFSTEDSDRCYVTTSNLDGETNLKTLLVPKIVSKMGISEIASMEATVTCQHPSSDLYRFHGKLEVNRSDDEVTTTYLTIENLLLRGSRLKDTDHIIGCAVYTGQDTKLSLNSKIRSNKFSTAEKSINKHIIIFMVLLLVEIILSCIMKHVIEETANWTLYVGKDGTVTLYSLVTDFLTFTVLYNYIVPISLYVTIELQKFFSSFFFSWDIDMYDENSDQSALTNTSDLNEELGQIEYLFADKTGTLTENLMVFKRCSVNGNIYMEKDCDGCLYLLSPDGDETKAMKLTAWEQHIWHFMISISLCHSVQITPPSQRKNIIARRTEYRKSYRLRKILQLNSSLLMHPDLPEYQAASADEKALVEASARCGVVFQKSTSDKIELRINRNILTFEKLEVLEFTSERKRMSVIVKDAALDYWLYCKGADSAILPLIVSGDVNQAIAHVADFARRGLRTLIIAYKKMNQVEYENLVQNVEQARQIIGIERAAYMERAYNMMEGGLTLLGVTGVEDRLQEGVQETLECLQVAGIKIWVLTGDKAETAENIAFLCGQFKDGTEILRMLDVTENRTCIRRLTDFDRRIKLEPYRQYGMLVDGCSIAIALKNYPEQFRAVGMACNAVVCCRLTPLQKSEIVMLIKTARSKPHTAAIGDGGNDVSMIQEAHVGIGIMGKEGRQATMCSDFAIAKFRFLKKALLVHGHWYYLRISILTQYFFYKNFIFIMPQLFYGLQSGFSAQAFYDGMFLMMFNVLFTSLPILAYGLLEQDYSADKLLRFPYLYKLNRRNYLLSGTQFLIWTLLGCWHTCIIYFMSYIYTYINPIILYNNTPMDQWSYSTCVFHLVTLIANLEVLLRSSYWTFPFVTIVLLSQLSFFGLALTYSLIDVRYDGDMLRVFEMLVSSISFWLLTLIVVVACVIPDYLIRVYNCYRPTFITRRNEEQPQYIIINSNDNTESVPLETRNQGLYHFVPWKNTFVPQKVN
ncbi:phospholipid-transporting ATPase IF isoform X1 [Osmia lignaria lignaria]|uniref:phospholipid-transporting ATPase IF isoform X1 n=1 Tax=Osmia lignaria lignaria TaxID=1437193 RepID=UPI001478AF1F|nr:probable phospholipid-transporting ATPase IF isoform X1 [Osmia lignaria]